MKPLVFLGGVTRTYGKVFVFWIRSFVGIGCLHAATLNLHRQLGLKIINKGRKISGWGKHGKLPLEKIQGKIFAECHKLMTSDQRLPLNLFLWLLRFKKQWPFKFRKRVTSKQFLLVPKMDVHSWICFASLLLDSCWDHWTNQPKFTFIYFTSYPDFGRIIISATSWEMIFQCPFCSSKTETTPQKNGKKTSQESSRKRDFLLTQVSSTWRCDSR